MAEKKKVWFYQRVGKASGAEEKLARQKKDMLDFAAQQGWATTGDVFDMGTGPSLTRPSIAKLMEAAQERKFDVLLIDKTPSICKDRLRALSVLAAIQERGVEIYCPEEGAIDAIKEAQELQDQAVADGGSPMPVLDAMPYHESKIFVIFANGRLRIFDYAASTHGQLTSCEQIAVAADGYSVTLNGSFTFSADQLLRQGKTEARQLLLGYAWKNGEIVTDPIEVPIVRRLFELYQQDRFFKYGLSTKQAGPIISEETWKKCCEAASIGAPSEGPELGMNMK